VTLGHAAVAMAERQHASGAELLNAVVLRYDVGIRLIGACGGLFSVKDRYRPHSDFLSAVGASVACGWLAGLDPRPAVPCHGASNVPGRRACSLFRERRHISKAFCNGQSAFAGVSAALMFAAGFESCDDVLGEGHGLLDACGTAGGAETVVRGLGQDYAVMGADFKVMRAGYPLHARRSRSVATIATVSGTTVFCRVDHPQGHSFRGGATWPDLFDKWRDALADSDAGSWITVAQGLDDLEAVSQRSGAFAGKH
jgi:hypothetical protein